MPSLSLKRLLSFQCLQWPPKALVHVAEEKDDREPKFAQMTTDTKEEERVEHVDLHDDSNFKILMSQRLVLENHLPTVEKKRLQNKIIRSTDHVEGQVIQS